MTAPSDDLRRRLYRPGATDEDVRAYRDAVERIAVAPPPPPPPPPPRLSRRGALAVAAGGALLAAAAGAAFALRTPAPHAVATADAGAVALHGTSALEAVGTTVPERMAFIRALTDGGPAGLGLWLDHRAPDLPGALATATRSETIELAGDGDETVRLAPVSLGNDGGRVTVLLVSAVDTDGGWTAARPLPDAGGVVHLTSTSPRSGALRAGDPVVAGFAYLPGERPTTLRVLLPDGIRWGAAVVFSD